MSHKAFIVGGAGATVTLDDVVKVVLGAQVALDHAASDRVKKDSPPPKSFQPEEPPSEAPAVQTCLDAKQTRAALLFKLLSLINGRSKVRLAVVESLAAILNAGIVPCLPAAPTDHQALVSLAAAMHGLGSTCSPSCCQATIAESYDAACIQPPGLSTAERAALEDGQSASGGVGAVCVQGSKLLLAAANAVAALSAEALQAEVKALDAETVEAQPYKGAVEAAGDMRALLEGSRQVNARRGAGVGTLSAITTVPQVHGAAMESAAAAAIPVKAELASAALPPAKDLRPQQASSPALATALTALASALAKAAALSLRRSSATLDRLPAVAGTGAAAGAEGANADLAAAATAAQQGLQGLQQQAEAEVDTARRGAAAAAGQLALEEGGQVPSLAAAQACYACYQALLCALSCEALTAVASLRLQEGEPPAAGSAGAAAAEAAVVADGGDKKKDKKKEKGVAGGMALGKGSQLLRSFLETAAAARGAISTANGDMEAQFLSLSLTDAPALRQQLAAVHAALDPLGPSLPSQLAALQAVMEANQVRRKPKIAKGARDFMPDQMAIREVAFNRIVSVFKRHGAVSIDTPVFELRETLMGKYGEDSKLIYDLADQGGELLSLRYDLTVPFARYVALHGIANIKRYHIAKVYRRDQPQMTRGRFREFFQCDFDIAGSYPTMVPDAEVIKVLVEILDSLSLGQYQVKLNHRRLLDAMLDIAGVPPQKFRPICSAIDKLDKEPWEAVRQEMVEEKGLPGEVADRIGEFVVLRGQPLELLKQLQAPGHPLAEHPDSKAALDELAVLFGFLESMGALGPLSFDLSLARGLDYYTGVIYEAVLKGGNVGSIAAGGRYDKLVGMFSGKEVPAVGVSIGIERVFAIMEAQMRQQAEQAGGTIRETETEVLVASIGSGMQQRRMEICSRLWAAGVKAEFGFKPNPKMADQLGYALKAGIPFMLLFGESEIEQGVVKLKDLDAGTEEAVPLAQVVEVVGERVRGKGERRIVYAQQKA